MEGVVSEPKLNTTSHVRGCNGTKTQNNLTWKGLQMNQHSKQLHMEGVANEPKLNTTSRERGCK